MLQKELFNIEINPFLELLKKLNSSVLEIYKTSFDVTYKNDNSPLTKADELSHDVIKQFLNKNYPNIPVVSEENEEQKYNNFEQFFLVDPIDGTQEFVDKTDEFCICIALVKNKEAIFGIISDPVKNEILYASKDKGAYIYKDKTSKKLSGIRFDKNVLISKSHLDKKVLPFIKENFSSHKVLRKGSALKFCDIVKGEADTTLRFAPTYLWDTAAANVLLEEVGKSIVNIHTNKKLQYESTNLFNPGFKVI